MTEPPRRRPGGRSARVRDAVIAATLDELLEHGLAELTLGRVAARAGVAETTIYRRWGSRTALIADALTGLAAAGNPPPDTGSVREDLRLLAEQVRDLIAAPAITRLLTTVAALAADPELAAARRAFWDHRFEQTRPIVERARAAGLLRAEADPRVVVESLVAPLYFRVLVTGEALGDDIVTRCVDDTLRRYGTA
ncbi:TetR/AcrR family transcriptional regulator [Nocardia sp. NPDC050697]|uniref:TetR/AcrR family transcriptional regulator n=1 Tax=Nocardia sp. NPDC050697 TaxID=3155158 RepID=UPI0033C81F5D